MKKGWVFLVISIFIISSISFGFAQDEEAQVDMPRAGITPGSIFYGFDVFFDNVRVALTFRQVNKAKLRLKIMEERMAEMQQMAEQNQVIEAEKAEAQVQEQMQKFEGSVEKVKKKDAPELNEHIQAHSSRLEILQQRLGDSDWAEAINDAITMLEELENIIVDIPEDLSPSSIFILSQICEDAGATTAAECQELIASGALTARFGRLPANHTDPHNCSGHYSSYITQTKWCCDDSDGTYSPEYIESILSNYDEHVSGVLASSPHMLNYYHRAGTVEYKIINLETNEIEQGIETDSCDGDTLIEWFCPTSKNMVTKNQRYSEEYDCPNGCEGGKCIICNLDFICDENEDCSCSDCEGKRNGCGHPHSVCQDGDCVYKMEGVEQECTDSDNGIDYFMKGTVNASYSSGLTTYYYTTIDRCIDEVMLGEGLCGTNEARVVMYSCPNGCEDGVCIIN